MEADNDYAVNRLKILSTDQSFNKETGALIIKGGLGVSKAISAKCLNVDTLTIKENTIIKNDLTVNNLTFDCLIPANDTSSIGCCEKRVYNFYSNYVDTNCQYVNDSLIANTVKANRLVVGDDSCCTSDPTLVVDNIKRFVSIDSLLSLKYQNLTINQATYNLQPASTIIILKSNCASSITLLKTDTNGNGIIDGTLLKIYNKSTYNLTIDSNCLSCNGFAEFLYETNQWTMLVVSGTTTSNSNNSCKDDTCKDDTCKDDTCKDDTCDNKCNDTTTECGDSSVFTVDQSL